MVAAGERAHPWRWALIVCLHWPLQVANAISASEACRTGKGTRAGAIGGSFEGDGGAGNRHWHAGWIGGVACYPEGWETDRWHFSDGIA